LATYFNLEGYAKSLNGPAHASSLLNGLFWSWPRIFAMVMFLRLFMSYLPVVHFPCLLVMQASTLQKLCALKSVTANDPVIQGRVSVYNRNLAHLLLHMTRAINPSGSLQPLSFQLTFEQWAALYLLLMQAVAFWGALWVLAAQEHLLRCRLAVNRRLNTLPATVPPPFTKLQMGYIHAYVSSLLYFYVTYESFKGPTTCQ
jgi:hypothetical protein